MTRSIALAVVLSLSAVSCSTARAADPSTTTTTAPSTTTTTAPSTTTTTAPVATVATEDEALSAFITGFYGYARGDVEQAPAGAPALVPEPGSLDTGTTVSVEASAAPYGDGSIAVWTSDAGDVVGAIQQDGTWQVVAGRAPSVGTEPWYGDGPFLVAVVGSDARPGENIEATRADSIHIVGLDGAGGAGIVGIPRDSWVPINGGGRSKINSALANGGPEAMMNTFEDLSGLDLDGYVLTGFEGFVAMVDDVLGPFQLDVPFAFSDKAAKADFAAGPQEIDGRDALAFARTRKAFSAGDFQRQLHGGLLLIAGAGAAKLRGPLSIPELISGTQTWMSTDLGPEGLLTLSLLVHELDLLSIDNVVLDGWNSTAGRASIVRLDADSAAAVFADLADGRLDD